MILEREALLISGNRAIDIVALRVDESHVQIGPRVGGIDSYGALECLGRCVLIAQPSAGQTQVHPRIKVTWLRLNQLARLGLYCGQTAGSEISFEVLSRGDGGSKKQRDANYVNGHLDARHGGIQELLTHSTALT